MGQEWTHTLAALRDGLHRAARVLHTLTPPGSPMPSVDELIQDALKRTRRHQESLTSIGLVARRRAAIESLLRSYVESRRRAGPCAAGLSLRSSGVAPGVGGGFGVDLFDVALGGSAPEPRDRAFLRRFVELGADDRAVLAAQAEIHWPRGGPVEAERHARLLVGRFESVLVEIADSRPTAPAVCSHAHRQDRDLLRFGVGTDSAPAEDVMVARLTACDACAARALEFLVRRSVSRLEAAFARAVDARARTMPGVESTATPHRTFAGVIRRESALARPQTMSWTPSAVARVAVEERAVRRPRRLRRNTVEIPVERILPEPEAMDGGNPVDRVRSQPHPVPAGIGVDLELDAESPFERQMTTLTALPVLPDLDDEADLLVMEAVDCPVPPAGWDSAGLIGPDAFVPSEVRFDPRDVETVTIEADEDEFTGSFLLVDAAMQIAGEEPTVVEPDRFGAFAAANSSEALVSAVLDEAAHGTGPASEPSLDEFCAALESAAGAFIEPKPAVAPLELRVEPDTEPPPPLEALAAALAEPDEAIAPETDDEFLPPVPPVSDPSLNSQAAWLATSFPRRRSGRRTTRWALAAALTVAVGAVAWAGGRPAAPLAEVDAIERSVDLAPESERADASRIRLAQLGETLLVVLTGRRDAPADSRVAASPTE